jgi:cell division protein FtsB
VTIHFVIVTLALFIMGVGYLWSVRVMLGHFDALGARIESLQRENADLSAAKTHAQQNNAVLVARIRSLEAESVTLRRALLQEQSFGTTRNADPFGQPHQEDQANEQ